MIEMTVDKLRGHIPDDRVLILTGVKYKAVAQQTLPQIPPENFVYEPCLRDTASAIGLAATVLKTRCAAATMITLTADYGTEFRVELRQELSTKNNQPGDRFVIALPGLPPGMSNQAPEYRALRNRIEAIGTEWLAGGGLTDLHDAYPLLYDPQQ